jgi:hypothetical protein
MNEIKLVKFELDSYIAWPLKVIMAILAFYFANEVYIDYSNGFITRRGSQYTLVDSPISFYINIAMTTGFCLILSYMAIGGIVSKKIRDNK